MPNDGVGEVYEGQTLRPSRIYIQPASYITLDGVEPIVLLECEGHYEGTPFRFALEVSRENGGKIGESLVRLCT